MVHHPRLMVVAPDRYAADAAAHLATTIGMAVAARGACAIALAGGHTPEPVYRRLAADPLVRAVPWEALSVYFGDERAVPPDDPASNFRMAREALLGRVPLAADAVHRMAADAPERDAAARDYAALLPDPLDVLLLGIGPDGHTASLFPGSSALGERRHRVVAVTGPFEPRHRLTITPPVIAAARQVIVLASGDDKAGIVASALGEVVDIDRWPVQLARTGTWILDTAAASRLPQQGSR